MTQGRIASWGARLFPSLDQRDRKLLLVCLGLVVLIAIVVAMFLPKQDDNNPIPSSFGTGTRGAGAAYLALQRSGYHIERWEQRPLGELAKEADTHTVLILAEPRPEDEAAAKAAVAKILERGGRVVATGFEGAVLLPGNHAEITPHDAEDAECDARPEGLDAPAEAGVIHIGNLMHWNMRQPEQRALYTCMGDAVVVRYSVGAGQAIWWAGPQPLQNASIEDGGNLELLIQSLGPGAGTRVVWDESLHEYHELWSYADGTPVHLLWWQLTLVALLLVLSFGRRSGPLLADPVVARDTQLEFVQSLGALYEKAGATNTAVQIGYDRFRLLFGMHTGGRDGNLAQRAEQMVSVVHARVGHDVADLQKTIVDCEELAYAGEPMQSGRALGLVQQLWKYEDEIQDSKKGMNDSGPTEPNN